MISETAFPRAFAKSRVLLLSAHTDDCEIGMGATISRLVREGADIRWHVFSNAVESLPDGFGPETLLEEQRAAASSYGVPLDRLSFHDFPVRRFPEFRQQILDGLIRLRNDFRPNLVFCAARSDCHQDHETLTKEAFRAFKGTSILGYHLPWNSKSDVRQFTLEVSQDDVERREAAIRCYRSQSNRQYFTNFSRSILNEYYGSTGGFNFAEVFEVISIAWPIGDAKS